MLHSSNSYFSAGNEPSPSRRYTGILLLLLALAVAYTSYQFYQLKRIYGNPVSLLSPTPYSLPSFVPTQPPDESGNWRTYTSIKGGYSVQVPPQWQVKINEDDSLLKNQDYLVNMTILPEYEPLDGINANYIVIAFPISRAGPHKDMGKQYEQGLQGFVFNPSQPTPGFDKQQSNFINFSGKEALVNLQVYKATPPAGYAGSWCNCTHKHIYVDLGNGKILDILGFWQNTNPDFEEVFNSIMATIKFL